MYDTLIVGAGLAGLACARQLQQAGRSPLILEQSDDVGGRIRTDRVEGFQLDRGFQVLLDSYPEAQRVLDFAALKLQPFQAGALVRQAGKFVRVADPRRHPTAALSTLFSPVGNAADKLRLARLVWNVNRGPLAACFDGPEQTTLDALRQAGLSPEIVEKFLRPFLSGVFLDPKLRTSSKMFQFVFRMFSRGAACLPSAGMRAIPRQLAASLAADAIRLNTTVTAVRPRSVTLASGEQLSAPAVILAVEGPAAAKLAGGSLNSQGVGVTCLYYAAPRPPVDEPLLVLNGEGRGPINNLCVPTNVAATYGPPGEHLVSVSVLSAPAERKALEPAVRDQLIDWFGAGARDWRLLRTYRIPYALPDQSPPALARPERPVRHRGLYVCGDHLDNASIQGALVSGRRAAEAVLQDLWGVATDGVPSRAARQTSA
ncbi:MAG: FAD-dependent oxidoreductase [Planctomycetes bacterium]|nr:FAD-dependent oxidoreductase [Planctomycetota bacterium]